MLAPVCERGCLAARDLAARRRRRVCEACRAHVCRRARLIGCVAAAREAGVAKSRPGEWLALERHHDITKALEAGRAARRAAMVLDG